MAAPRYVDRRREIARQQTEVDEAVLLANAADDIDVRSNLQRFAVVRLSGFLETSVELMVNGFLEENSASRVLRFGQSNARKIMNLNPAKIEALLGNFDPDWRDAFSAFLAVDERRQTLDNLIKARHNIAHGKSTVVNNKVLDRYHALAEETVTHLLGHFLSLKPPK